MTNDFTTRMPVRVSCTCSDRREKPSCTALKRRPMTLPPSSTMMVMKGSGIIVMRARRGNWANRMARMATDRKKPSMKATRAMPLAMRMARMSLDERAMMSPVRIFW